MSRLHQLVELLTERYGEPPRVVRLPQPVDEPPVPVYEQTEEAG